MPWNTAGRAAGVDRSAQVQFQKVRCPCNPCPRSSNRERQTQTSPTCGSCPGLRQANSAAAMCPLESDQQKQKIKDADARSYLRKLSMMALRMAGKAPMGSVCAAPSGSGIFSSICCGKGSGARRTGAWVSWVKCREWCAPRPAARGSSYPHEGLEGREEKQAGQHRACPAGRVDLCLLGGPSNVQN